MDDDDGSDGKDFVMVGEPEEPLPHVIGSAEGFAILDGSVGTKEEGEEEDEDNHEPLSPPPETPPPITSSSNRGGGGGGGKKRRIHLLTHNLWCHYIGGSPDIPERMESFSKRLGQFDILLLQEVFEAKALWKNWGTEVRLLLRTEAELQGLPHFIEGNPPKIGQNSGLVIISKFPCSWHDEQTWMSILDPGTLKGYLHARIDIDGTAVHFFNVHFDSHRASRRKKQLELLCTHISKFDLRTPVLVAGDFNICPRTLKDGGVELAEAIATMKKAGLTELFKENPETFRREKDARFDYIFINNCWETVQDSDRKVENFQNLANGKYDSDHFGLSVYLTIKEGL